MNNSSCDGMTLFHSRLIEGIHRHAQSRRLNQPRTMTRHCSRCRRYTEWKTAFRSGEIGGGVVILHIEAGWECARCSCGWGFVFFSENQWRWMRRVGSAWPMSIEEARAWGVEPLDL